MNKEAAGMSEMAGTSGAHSTAPSLEGPTGQACSEAAGAASVPVVRIDVLEGSTQDVAREELRAGRQAPFAVCTREQRSGRGRLGRRWVMGRGDGVALTLAVRTSLPPTQRSFIPLAAGLAALDAIAAVLPGVVQVSDPSAGQLPQALGLKWPNDLVTREGRKVGGILVEAHGAEHLLIGVGINLRAPAHEGAPQAAWLLGSNGLVGAAESIGAAGSKGATGSTGSAGSMSSDGVVGAETAPRDPAHRADRADAVEIAAALEDHLATALYSHVAALDGAGSPVAAGQIARYGMTCVTLGCRVQVLPLGGVNDGAGARQDDPPIIGTATAIDDSGRLILAREGEDDTIIDVGDVLHLRSAVSAAGSDAPTGEPTQEVPTH